jgi:4-hydroxybenzoate polyprenyltransferase
MAEASASFGSRWGRFIQERFPPLSHLVLLGLFFVGNRGLRTEDPGREALRFAILVLAFLRLRIQDDLKDLSGDRALHPERPLPRGLIAPAEAWVVSFALAGLEALLALALGSTALVWWGVWFGFSLLMVREFFVGKWLAPHPELYALAHTPFALFAGWFLAGGLATPAVWRFGLVNWAVFTVFEFSRKTYGRDEEPKGAVSYSKRWGPGGAVLLSLATLVGACLAAVWALEDWGFMVFVLPLAAAGQAYVTVPTSKRARVFRVCAMASVLVIYAAAAWQRR